MSPTTMIVLGFVLGMRHATDADHVVAVTTIVAREKTVRAAAPIGALWGLGHTATILLVGGATILFGIVIPPRVGLSMELCVALMLVVLGGWSIRGLVVDVAAARNAHAPHHQRARQPVESTSVFGFLRPLLVGMVHGVAGSAAIALLVLATIRDSLEAFAYLMVFGAGTIAGMMAITVALALPIAATAARFARLHRGLAMAAGCASVVLGVVLFYRIGFVDRLFLGGARWTPG